MSIIELPACQEYVSSDIVSPFNVHINFQILLPRMNKPSTPIMLCAKSDVADGEILKIEKDDLSLAVYHVGRDFFVTDDACTHGPGSLSEGYLEGHIIECDFHNGAFDIRNGEVAAPPCMIPIKTYIVVPDEDNVVIESGTDD